MVASCCVKGCKTRFVKGGSITFHSFPKDEERRKIWESKMYRENFKATSSSKVCSKHFTSDCFDKETLGGTWLKKNAMPTVFDFSKQLPERKIIQEPFIKETSEANNEPVLEQDSRKRKHYIGDFDDHDMNSPTEARKLLFVAQNEVKNLNTKLRSIQRQNKRLEKRVYTLEDMIF